MRRCSSVLLLLGVLNGTAGAQGFHSVHSSNGTDVVAVGNSGLIFRSLTGGVTWTAVTPEPTTLRAVVSAGTRVLAAGDGGRLLESTNGGATWSGRTIGSGADLFALVRTGTTTWIAAGGAGTILASTDNGATWSPRPSGTTARLRALSFSDSATGFAGGDGGTLLTTANGGLTWSPAAGGGWTKDILSVSARGGTVYAVGSAGFAVKSTNGGAAWTPLWFETDSRSDVNVVAARTADSVLFAGGGGFIRVSSDGGARFQWGIHGLHAVVNGLFMVDGMRGWAVTEKNNVVLRTTDGGATWQMPQGTTVTQSWSQRLAVSATVRGNAFSISTFDRNTIYCALGTRVYVSTNRGDAWTQIATLPAGGSKVNSFYVSPKDTNLWVAAYGSPDRIVRTTNRGATWDSTITVPFTEYGMPLEMDGSHPDTLFFGPEDGALYRSTDFGKTWALWSRPGFRSPCDLVVIRDSASVLWCGDGITGTGQGEMFRSTDHGRNWTSIYRTSGSEIPTVASGNLDRGLGYATAWSSGGVQKSTNFGSSWSSVATTGSAWGVDIARDDPNVPIYGVYSGSLSYLSANAGASFSTAALSGSNYALLAYDRATFVAQQSGGIYKLAFTYTVPVTGSQALALLAPNGGEQWQYNTVRNVSWSSVGVDSLRIEYRTAPGSAWETVASSVPAGGGSYAWTIPGTATLQALVRVLALPGASPVDTSNAPFSILVPFMTAPKTVNFGAVRVGQLKTDTLRIGNSGTAPLTVSLAAVDSPAFFVSRSSFTIPPGSTDTLKVTFRPSAARVYNALLRLVNNSPSSPALVQLSGTGDPASGLEDRQDLPTEFALGANYPNPFNPSTQITFALPRQAFVTLAVYNAIGQEVASLVREQREAGTHSVTFTAVGKDGAQLPSGLYFYRITAGEFTGTRKMMLVK